MNIEIIKLIRFVLLIGSLLSAISVQATQVQGQINFSGLNYRIIGGKNFAKSTGIDFARGRVAVAGKTGDYRLVPSVLSMKLGRVTYDPFPPYPAEAALDFYCQRKNVQFSLAQSDC